MTHKFIRLIMVALAVCWLVPTIATAQDKLLKIGTVTCSQAQGSNPVSYCFDNNTNTFWHSPWGGTSTTFPVTLNITMDDACHIDYVRYIPRQDGNSNGNWNQVTVSYRTTQGGTAYTEATTVNLGGSSSASDIFLNGDKGVDNVTHIRITVKSGSGNFASAAEIQPYQQDNSKRDLLKAYFTDDLFTKLKPGITSTDDIDDPDVKAVVGGLLNNPKAYSKFRIGEYEAYRNLASLRSELRTSAQYCAYENPTGIYATAGKPMYVAVEGIGSYTVKLKVKNWLVNESSSSYALKNGLNIINPSSTGNCFIDYYTDNFKDAPNVKVHFINGKVQGYWDQATMTNDDWKEILALHPSATDSTIIITRSEHAQTAYPAFIWRQNCPDNIDSTMTLYEQVQWAERDMMGLTKYGRECKNRQFFYATTYGFMAAGGEGAYCHVGSLHAITKPDAKNFDFWGVGHEWGHNNQITPGFKWSGCGETTNNIYASWAQIHFTGNPSNLRLEDEKTGINDYSGMRGGRMQTYFEEGVRKGVQWQLQDGPDYHGATPSGTNNSRNYDHFVKLVPFWQLNLWGTLAGYCPDLIPMVIEGLRNTPSTTLSNMNNGQQQVNWMKMACDSAKIDLLPFFEKAGMLKPINAYIEDYGAGWNIITQKMIDDLKNYVAGKGYPAYGEELNYINGHNYTIYRDKKTLSTPGTLNKGCTQNGAFVTVQHAIVQNAVAFETYNSDDELIRITMYGLGSDDKHSYTQVLYPGGEDAAYIMAVGFDGERRKIYEFSMPQLKKGRYYTICSNSKGGYLNTDNCSADIQGKITWNLNRSASLVKNKAGLVWYAQNKDGKLYLQNPETGCYLGGSDGKAFTELVSEANAPYFVAEQVDEAAGTWTLSKNGTGQYLNSYSATNTGFYGGGSSDPNNIWKIAEYTSINVSIPSVGYKAIYYPFALEVPEGCVAYKVADLGNADGILCAILEEIDGIVPANVPAIIYKDGKTATVTMNLTTEPGDENAAKGNILFGTNLRQTGYKAGDFYGIALSNSVASLTPSTATSTTANTAYLMASKAFGVKALPLYTGIWDSVESTEQAPATNQKNVWYDLSGKPLNQTPTQSGIYILNGKKVLIEKQ